MMNIIYGCILVLFTSACVASIDAHDFPYKQMQLRHQALIGELRCPQCLNTNLAGSDAMIARDLRREVRRLLIDGKSDNEIYPLCMSDMVILCFILRDSIWEPYCCGLARFCFF